MENKEKTIIEWLRSNDEKITIHEAAELLGIKTKCKKNEICFKRAWFWQMIYDNEKNINQKNDKKKLSYAKLGVITDGQTHASVIHGVKQARKNKYWLLPYKSEVESIVKRIKF